MVNATDRVIELRETDDIKTWSKKVGSLWYSYLQMPGFATPAVVRKNGKPIPHNCSVSAQNTALKAAVGFWQNNTCGTQNGIYKQDTINDITKVFGKPPKKKKRFGKNRRSKR